KTEMQVVLLSSKVCHFRDEFATGDDRTSNIEHPTPNIEHPTSNIQNPKPNIQNPTSNVETQRDGIPYWELDVGCSLLDVFQKFGSGCAGLRNIRASGHALQGAVTNLTDRTPPQWKNC